MRPNISVQEFVANVQHMWLVSVFVYAVNESLRFCNSFSRSECEQIQGGRS
jgi:hypothetical protein